jgi:hypothetical protein
VIERVRANEIMRTHTNAYEHIPADTKNADIDTDKDKEKEKDTDKDTVTDIVIVTDKDCA